MNDKELEKLLDAIKELSNLSSGYHILCDIIVQRLFFLANEIDNGRVSIEKIIPTPSFSIIDELVSPRFHENLMSLFDHRFSVLSKISNISMDLRRLAERIIETMDKNERTRFIVSEKAIESAFKVAYQNTEKKIEFIDQSAEKLAN